MLVFDMGDSAAPTSTVRPYTVTGGRVYSALSDLPLEALVELLPTAARAKGLTPEKRVIINAAARSYVSIAELAVQLRLPAGVVRVLVCDLVDDDLVSVHVSPLGADASDDSPSLSLLESVLSGIDAL